MRASTAARGPGLHSAAQVAPGLREKLGAQARSPACRVDENDGQLGPCLRPRHRDITGQRAAGDHDELPGAGRLGAERLGAHRPLRQRPGPQRQHRRLVFGTERAQLPLTEPAELPTRHALTVGHREIIVPSARHSQGIPPGTAGQAVPGGRRVRACLVMMLAAMVASLIAEPT